MFLGMVIYDNEFETKENKIWTKDKIKPQQVFVSVFCITSLVIAPIQNTNSRGQKSWDLPSNISKTSDPPPPPPIPS